MKVALRNHPLRPIIKLKISGNVSDREYRNIVYVHCGEFPEVWIENSERV
jgi:hypothetical protein